MLGDAATHAQGDARLCLHRPGSAERAQYRTTYEVRRREARDRTSNEFVTCVVSRRHAVRLLPVRNIHQR